MPKTGRSPKLSLVDCIAVYRAYQDWESVNELAEKWFVSPNTIRRALDRAREYLSCRT